MTKWVARSLYPQARSSLLARQLLALPHGSRDLHPEGEPCARTHALPTATSVPGCGPPAHCKVTTGDATLLAQVPVWLWVHTGQDTQLRMRSSVPAQCAPVPCLYCSTTTPV